MSAPAGILIVGAGALGTVYGACLARGGADVQLLARREHAEAIQRAGGVEVEALNGTWRTPLRAEWRPEEVVGAHTVIVMTKSHDTAGALAELDHISAGVQLAVSFQNGVEKDRLLSEWCGAEHVLGGMSMVGATMLRPGAVRHTLNLPTYIGELPSGTSARAQMLADALEQGGLPVVLTTEILSAEWSKLVHAAPTMTLTGLSRLPFHRVLLDPGLTELYLGLLHEGAAVAAAAGVALHDWPGMFPVKTLTTLPRAEATELVHQRGREMEAAGSTNVRVSMLTDIERGRPLELSAVHGFLVAEADRLGIDVPLSRTALELLSAIDVVRA